MKQNKDEWQKWMDEIVRLHGLPCLLLIKIDKQGRMKLLAAGTNSEVVGMVSSERERMPDYMG